MEHLSKIPKKSGKSEVEAYKGLQECFHQIVDAATDIIGRPSVLVFKYNPNSTPLGERNNDSRPDSQMELKKMKSLGFQGEGLRALAQGTSAVALGKRPVARGTIGKKAMSKIGIKMHANGKEPSDPHSHWEDIVLPLEYKLRISGGEDNISKLIWSAHHILRTDPCRRFTFGITVEYYEMRLWFFARSHVMVTEPFNFVQGVDTLIRIFVGLAFADDSTLGFDPTVSRIVVGGRVLYKYQIGEHAYITQETLSDFAADFIRGRGTRVFKAYLESNPNVVVALKDMWLEDDRTPEGYLLETLRNDIIEKQAQGFTFPSEKDPSEYFLTVHAHGRVKVDNVTDDHTTKVVMRGSNLPSDVQHLRTSPLQETIYRNSRVAGSDRGYSVGHTPIVSREVAALVRDTLPRVYPHFQARIHYRIAFNEVGKTIHELRDLSQVYQCLVDATTALEILHILGYVHRDVSAGNVLLYNDAGILADLEFAKKTSDLTVHERRTGTNQFESVEVAAQTYLFRGFTATGRPPAFRFNCIHDLESTWWIAFWVLCRHVPQEDNGEHNEQQSHATELFPPTGSSTKRLVAFVHGGLTRTIALLPPTFQDNAKWLLDARALLVDRYVAAEGGSQIDETAFDNLHQELAQIWAQAQEDASGLEYRILRAAKRGIMQESGEPHGHPRE